MEVLCPACTRQLSVPQLAPGTALQCPYCGSMFQLAAPQAAPYGSPPGAGPAIPPSVPMAPTPQSGPGTLVVESKPRIRRRRRNDTAMLVVLGLCGILLVGGLIAAGVWLSRSSSSTTPTNPSEIASHQAQQFLIKEAELPATVQFPPELQQVQSLPNRRWVVSGFVHVPGRMGNVYLRQQWAAQVSQLPDGAWKLDRLQYDGRTVAASGGDEPPSRFGERSRWLTGDNDNTGGGGYAPQVDRSTRWAVERLATEIRESASLHNTLVVWLIDRSMSVRPQQQEFLRHVDLALRELKPADSGGEPKLSMAVVSFGQDVKFPLEQPSSKADEVRTALESIEEDASGREMVFTAVQQAAEKFGRFRMEKNGYVLFVLLSDEIGDDEAQLDQTVALVKQHQIAVHGIGVSAPFGLPVAEAQKGLEGQSGSVRQGPESRYAEMISLASIGGVAVELDSGFGPFSLARLCANSGGQYLACQDFGVAAGSRYLSVSWGGNVSSRASFDPAVMRRYAPDYVSEQEYQQILASNKACQALHEAAKLPFAEVLVSANTVFTKRDEASFKRSLDMAQRDAAKFEPRLIALHETLRKGESDRPMLTRPRWQAAYDLAMGRALAARVKTEGYNTMLAKIKAAGNFTNPNSTTWVLQESETIGAGSTFEKMLAQSREYLQRVVKEHPGTPWAYLAERELQIKAGWQWTEQ